MKRLQIVGALFLPQMIIDIIEEYWRTGATHIESVTHTFPDRIQFIGEKVLPYFRRK
jgi:hypothetical protein